MASPRDLVVTVGLDMAGLADQMDAMADTYEQAAARLREGAQQLRTTPPPTTPHPDAPTNLKPPSRPNPSDPHPPRSTP